MFTTLIFFLIACFTAGSGWCSQSLGDDALVAAPLITRLQLGVLRLRAVVRVKDDNFTPSAAAVV